MVLLILKADMVAELLAVLVLLALAMAVKELPKQQVVLVLTLAYLVKEEQVFMQVMDMVALAAVAGMEGAEFSLIALMMMIKVAVVVLVMYILHRLLLTIHLDVYLTLLII